MAEIALSSFYDDFLSAAVFQKTVFSSAALCYVITSFGRGEIICEFNQKNEYVTALFLSFADIQPADSCTPAQFYRYGNDPDNGKPDSDRH